MVSDGDRGKQLCPDDNCCRPLPVHGNIDEFMGASVKLFPGCLGLHGEYDRMEPHFTFHMGKKRNLKSRIVTSQVRERLASHHGYTEKSEKKEKMKNMQSQDVYDVDCSVCSLAVIHEVRYTDTRKLQGAPQTNNRSLQIGGGRRIHQ